MPKRDYILRSPEPGLRGRTVMETTTHPGGRECGSAALWLPDGISPEIYGDVLGTLRKAYQAGREDRSAELIPSWDEPADFLRDLVRSCALDAIGQWATGWTDGTDEHGQYHIGLHGADEINHTLDVRIGKKRHETLKRFRVQVLVEEIEQR